MTTVDPTNHSGNDELAQYFNPSDWTTCPRCGLHRRTRHGRGTGLCRDCRTVEHHAAKIIGEPAQGYWVLRHGVRVLVQELSTLHILFCTPLPTASTSSVDSRVFDSNQPIKGVA